MKNNIIKTSENPTLIFTDLDGSLLDHQSYSHKAADPILALLKNAGIAVIPNTSKTLAELLPIRKELNNTDPFIVENGAAIYFPAESYDRPKATTEFKYKGQRFWQHSLASPRNHWQQLLASIEDPYRGLFISFNQLGIEGICQATGLSKAAAELANQRSFSEPVQWLGSADEKQGFIKSVRALGANVLEGGRFLHLIDRHICKASAMIWLTDFYNSLSSSEAGKPVYKNIAIGDSHNDISMLQAADMAIVIRSPAHPAPKIPKQKNIAFSSAYGPQGWSDEIAKLFNFKLNPLPKSPTN